MKMILVVDDNKVITGVVRLMLESAGYGCTTANSAQEGLKLIRSYRFDLVLLDVAMPEVTGIDLLNKLMEDGTFDRRRIIFFTASSFTDTEIEDLKKKYGVLDCIRKPTTKAKLVEVIERSLAQSEVTTIG